MIGLDSDMVLIYKHNKKWKIFYENEEVLLNDAEKKKKWLNSAELLKSSLGKLKKGIKPELRVHFC